MFEQSHSPMVRSADVTRSSPASSADCRLLPSKVVCSGPLFAPAHYVRALLPNSGVLRWPLLAHYHQIPGSALALVCVLRGHYAYYGVPTNIEALDVLHGEVTQRWRRSLLRRSQRRRLNWVLTDRLAVRWLPAARIVHPWPQERFVVRTRDKSPVR
jgi:hypothetical protein